MLRDRTELEHNLRISVDRVKYKRKNIEEINKTLTEFDIPPGFFNEICKKEELLSEIDATILCLVTIALFKVDGAYDIRPETYFTQGEIEAAKNYKVQHNSDSSLPITINNVLQLGEEDYITTIKMTELVKMFHAKLIIYDFETQRSPKYKRGKDGVIPIPDINVEAVKAISKKMLEETYLPDVMSLNLYSDDLDPIAYNPKTKTMTIKKGTVISILDGFHRLQGGIRAVSIDPDLKQIMGLNIKIYDKDTAQKFFGQINTITPVSSAKLQELKQEKLSYITVKYLQSSSDLKGKIASGGRTSSIAGHWTTTEILANIIDEVFEPRNTMEAREVGIYLADFFSYLLGIYDDEFASKDSIMKHPRMFIGYVIVAKWFKDNNISLKSVKSIKDNLNLNSDNDQLFELLTNNKGTHARLQRKVKQYFESIDMTNISFGG